MIKNPEILQKFENEYLQNLHFSIEKNISIFNDMEELYLKLKKYQTYSSSNLPRWNIKYKKMINDAYRPA